MDNNDVPFDNLNILPDEKANTKEKLTIKKVKEDDKMHTVFRSKVSDAIDCNIYEAKRYEYSHNTIDTHIVDLLRCRQINLSAGLKMNMYIAISALSKVTLYSTNVVTGIT